MPAEIAAAEQGLNPATAKDWAVCLRKLTDFVRAFGLPLSDLKAAAGIYRETLTELPADLLGLAIQRTAANHVYHVLPKPAEIRAQVDKEMADRKARLGLARTAYMIYRRSQGT